MIRFYNGRVLLSTPQLHLTNDEVWVDGTKISYVGPAKVEMPAFDREIDLNGDLLIPGFKNAHAHSAMTFLRSFADDLPLQEWLYHRVFPMEAKLNPEIVYEFTRLAILEYLSSGITSAFDMYFYNDSAAAANIDSGFRTVLCGSIMQFDKDLTKMEGEYTRLNSFSPLVSYRLGFHAEYTANEKVIDYARYLSQKYSAPVCAHSSETENEVAGCIQRHGVTPTVFMEQQGLLEFGGTFFHCAYMTDEDMEILKKHGCYAVTNPSSNLKLASGVAPILRLQEKGVKLAIGTDGPASNNALDMFREMYLVSVLQKLVTRDAAACDALSVLDMATRGGAYAMGLYQCAGIEEGMQADLAVIDMTRPSMQPEHSILKNLVYAGSKDCVRMTVVAGRILYENGEFFVGEEPAKIYEKCAALLNKIKE